jgi:hypothetical protein
VVAPATLARDEVLAVVRRRRNALLAACDWTQATDSPISTTDRSAWAEYRQALRTLPETITDPASIVWPVAPRKRIRHDRTDHHDRRLRHRKRTVPVTFTSGAIRHTREVNAVLDEGGATTRPRPGRVSSRSPLASPTRSRWA